MEQGGLGQKQIHAVIATWFLTKVLKTYARDEKGKADILVPPPRGNEIRSISHPIQKVYPKYIKDLNLVPKMIKLPEENNSRYRSRLVFK